MKSSEIINCLKGRENWADFGNRYREAILRLKARKDGAMTSSDIGLLFDETFVLESKHMNTLLNLENEEIWIYANLVALCGFEARTEEIENKIYALCESARDA